VATGLGAVFNTARVQPGDRVAVIGCGGVGLSAVQGARIAGSAQIIAIDPVPEKLDLAEAFGATDVVDARAEDLVDRVIEISDGLGVDHVIEAVGRVDSVEKGFAMTRRGGTIRLQGSTMGSNDFKVHVPRYIEMYLDGRLNLGDLVTERISLDQVNEGFESMATGKNPRTIIEFD
jgi:S-(hydroxymethyl)glutathione dehydrogenase/alcohol dehydrogenase